MVAEREIREAEDDEALLRSLIRPEEDRRRLHPELSLAGRLSLVPIRQCHTDGTISRAASDLPGQVSGRV